MVAARPIPPNHRCHKFATATFDLHEIANHWRRPVEAVLVLTQFAFGHYLTRLKDNPFYPVTHIEI